jgi:hypothetical protein
VTRFGKFSPFGQFLGKLCVWDKSWRILGDFFSSQKHLVTLVHSAMLNAFTFLIKQFESELSIARKETIFSISFQCFFSRGGS